MINLFERFDFNAELIFQTFNKADLNHTTVVIEDDGFLPQGVLSPYQYFSKFKPLKNDRGLFFNEVEVPTYWEIDGNNNNAKIKDMGKIRGNIHYRKGFKNRIVSHVEWLDESGKVRSIDYYNQYGFKYANKVLDLRGVAILKTYFDRQGKVVIYENYITNDFVVTYKGKDHFFNSKVAFVQFYLKRAFDDLSQFVINSLSVPFIALYQLGIEGTDYLVWQEGIGDDIPGNMKVLLESKIRDFKIVVPDENVYHRLQEIVRHDLRRRFVLGGYVYQYVKKPEYNENILTLTNSDQLEHVETFVKRLPNHVFHIAAVTEMSPKLMGLGKYKNVKLYPNVKHDVLMNIYKESSIYLDINHGGELLDAVRGAFEHNMLILGFNELAKNKIFTAPAHLFAKTDVEECIKKIELFDEKPKQYISAINKQKLHANEVSLGKIKKVFK